MSAILIAEYLLSQKKQKGTLPQNSALIKSIVSSIMINELVEKYNIKLFEVLTGFKYIGEKIKEFEEKNDYKFLFGYEESYGCLVGTHARDKDAIVAVMILCEAAAYYKTKGLTLWDQMLKIYEEYGFYKEGIIQVTLEGIDGAEKIKSKLEKLRKEPLETIGNYNVLKIRDYENETIKDMKIKQIISTGLPKSNVIYYELSNNAWCCIRPSGTEPKIKYYIGVKGTSLEDADKKIEELKKYIEKI